MTDKPKNAKLLRSFTSYCKNNPDQRFWQALRNWSEYNFIYGYSGDPYKLQGLGLEDTFYKE